MTPTIVVLVFVISMSAMSFLVAGLMVRGAFSPIVSRFPPVTPAPDAVRRRFQSFRFGLVNAGFSMHVAADESHLHLIPISLIRPFGFRPASIPWSEIQVQRVGRVSGTARVAGLTMMGPAWCLRLAESDSGGDPTHTSSS